MKFLNWSIDKYHHFVYSYAICLTICLLLSFLKVAPIIAILVAMAVGIFKEIRDIKNPKASAELKDLFADGLGITAAIIIYYLSKMLIKLFIFI